MFQVSTGEETLAQTRRLGDPGPLNGAPSDIQPVLEQARAPMVGLYFWLVWFLCSLSGCSEPTPHHRLKIYHQALHFGADGDRNSLSVEMRLVAAGPLSAE